MTTEIEPTACKTCGKLPTMKKRPDGKFQFGCCKPGIYGWGVTIQSAIFCWDKVNGHGNH